MTSFSKYYIGKRVEANEYENEKETLVSQSAILKEGEDARRTRLFKWVKWFFNYFFKQGNERTYFAINSEDNYPSWCNKFDENRYGNDFLSFITQLDDFIKQSCKSLIQSNIEAVSSLTKYIKHILYFLYVLATRTSINDVIFAGAYIISNVINQKTQERVARLLAEFYDTAKRCMPLKAQADYEPGRNNRYSDFLTAFLDSNLFLSIKSLILNIVSLEFFPYPFYKTVTKHLGKMDKVPTPLEALRNILRSVEDMFVTVHKAIKAGSLKAVLFDEDPKAEFLDKAIDLINHYDNIYFGKSENFHEIESMKYRIPFDKFMISLSSCISKGDAMLVAFKHDMLFRTKHNQLKKIHAELYSRVMASKRSPPFAIVIHGTPQIGKSSLLVHFYKLLARYLDLEWSDDLVFTRNVDVTHWDGYDPVAQPIIHIPEVGSEASSIVASKGSVVLNELLSIVDSAPYPVNIAELESKGRVYAHPKMVVVDTNNEKMNVEYTQSNPAAVLRRFIFVEPIVKTKFRVDGGVALDPTKIGYDDNPMDLWTFNVKLQIPRDSKQSTEIQLGTGVDIFELTKIIDDKMDKHFTQNEHYMRMLNEPIDTYLKSQSNVDIDINLTSIVYYVLSFHFLLTLIDNIYYLLLYVYSYLFQGALYTFICASFESLAWRAYKWRLTRKYSKEIKVLTSICIAAPIVFGAARLCLTGASFLRSQSDYVDSSGDYTEDNYKSKLSEVESKSSVRLPKPKTKLDSDKDYDIVEHFVPRVISDKRNYNKPLEVFNTVIKNRRYVHVTNDRGTITRTNMLGLFGDWAIINSHAIYDAVSFEVSRNPKVLVDSYKFSYNKNDIIKLPNDLSLIRSRRSSFKDIRFSLCSDLLKVGIDFQKLDWNTGEVSGSLIRSIEGRKVGSGGSRPHTFTLPTYLKYPGYYKAGDCGNPLIAIVNNQTFLVGIHSAGDDDYGYATTFTSDVLTHIPREVGFEIYSEGAIRMPKGQSLGPVSPGSPLYYEGTFGFHVLGGLQPLKVVKPRSTLKLSSIVNEIEYLINISPYISSKILKFDAPKMGRKCINGTHGPYNIWLRKLTKEKKYLPVENCEIVSNILLNYFLDNTSDEKLSPFTLSVAQNGYPFNFYIRSMKNSTSGGYSFPGKKRNYLSDSPQEWKCDAVEPDFSIIEQVLEIIDSYQRSETALNILGAQLKDEPRPREKVDKGSTRVFAMSGYPETLVNRMYLLPFYTMMISDGDVFRTAIGANMHGTIAHEMRTRIWSLSNNFFGGDYGGYDTSMPVDIGYQCNDIICRFLHARGYNEYSMKIVRGILSDNLFPLLMVDGAFIQVPGFQPSGKYATAEDNSLRGLYLLFYAFCIMCTNIGLNDKFNTTTEFEPLDFFRLTYILIYGDDNIGSVADCLKDHFNNLTYKRFCEEVYGMDFTLPLKGEISEKFLDESEVSFLKRTFRYHKGLKRYAACLDKESMVKSLSWNLPSSEVSIDVQTIETMTSVLRELFFWCDDEDDYNSYRNRFVQVAVKKFNFSEHSITSQFPTYHKILNSLSEPTDIKSQSHVRLNVDTSGILQTVDLDDSISIYDIYAYTSDRHEELEMSICDYRSGSCVPQFIYTRQFYILHMCYDTKVLTFVEKTNDPDFRFINLYFGLAELSSSTVLSDESFLNSQSGEVEDENLSDRIVRLCHRVQFYRHTNHLERFYIREDYIHHTTLCSIILNIGLGYYIETSNLFLRFFLGFIYGICFMYPGVNTLVLTAFNSAKELPELVADIYYKVVNSQGIDPIPIIIIIINILYLIFFVFLVSIYMRYLVHIEAIVSSL